MPTPIKLIENQDEAGTEYKDMEILVATPRFSVYALPKQLKPTHRILLKYGIGSFIVDADNVKFTIYYRRDKTDTEETLPYDIIETDLDFKEKLPPGILVNEFRIEISSPKVQSFESSMIGMLAETMPVGDR